jgi:hypothetical protein
MTGFDFDKLFDRKTDKAYTGFFNPTKKTALYREALILAIENKYRNLDEQREYDDLSGVTKTNQVYSLLPSQANQIYTQPLAISAITVTSSQLIITTVFPHYLAVGQNMTTSGIQGYTTANPINGTFPVLSVTNANTLTLSGSFGSVMGSWTAGSGQISFANMISDYRHLLTIKAKFTRPLKALSITNATNATPIVITVSTYNNIRTGEQLQINQVVGNTAANGTFYVQQISSFSFQLFTDKALATPVVGNANYVSGGIMAKVDYQYASPLVPDRKKDMYSAATSIYPKAETANGMLKIQPFDLSCTEITIDYITTDLVDINPLDSALNLELTYPADFLYYVADTAANLAAKTVRDQELLQTSTTDINNEK